MALLEQIPCRLYFDVSYVDFRSVTNSRIYRLLKMPQVSSDSYEDKNMWKGWVFVLQGRFKDMAKKPMDHTAIARLIRQHGGEVHSRVTDVTKLRNRSVKHYVLVTTIEEVVKTRGMNGKSI